MSQQPTRPHSDVHCLAWLAALTWSTYDSRWHPRILSWSGRAVPTSTRTLISWCWRLWGAGSRFVSELNRKVFINQWLIQFSFNLGSGILRLEYNTTRVDDGRWHRVRATRWTILTELSLSLLTVQLLAGWTGAPVSWWTTERRSLGEPRAIWPSSTPSRYCILVIIIITFYCLHFPGSDPVISCATKLYFYWHKKLATSQVTAKSNLTRTPPQSSMFEHITPA